MRRSTVSRPPIALQARPPLGRNKRRLERVLAVTAALAIVALALWLRLERLDLIEFKTDEGANLQIAEDFDEVLQS